MEILASLSWGAVVAAAIANMLVGFLWYSPFLFGNAWMKEMDLKEKDMPAMPAAAFKGLVNSIFFAVILSLLFLMFSLTDFTSAWHAALLVWAVFIHVQFAGIIWAKQSCKLFAIEVGYMLASLTVVTAVLVYVA